MKKAKKVKMAIGALLAGTLAVNLSSCAAVDTITDTIRAMNNVGAVLTFHFQNGVTFEKINEDGEEFYQVIGCITGAEEVEIPAEHWGLPVSKIDIMAFRNCQNLKKVTLPSSIKHVDLKAFENCVNLTEVVMPSGLVKLGSAVFSGCKSLKELALPDSVTDLSGAFEGCELESLTVDDGNPVYKSVDDCFIERESKTLLYAFENFSIPTDGSVTALGDGVFKGREWTSYEIPDFITTIGASAFKNCSQLTKIEIPNSVTEIGWGAFEGCKALASVAVPDGVTRIEERAFRECVELKSVVIPASVVNIDVYAFNGCRKLARVYYGGTYESWKEIAIQTWGHAVGDYSNWELTEYSRIHYYAKTPPAEEDHKYYWRYVDGVPTAWER